MNMYVNLQKYCLETKRVNTSTNSSETFRNYNKNTNYDFDL